MQPSVFLLLCCATGLHALAGPPGPAQRPERWVGAPIHYERAAREGPVERWIAEREAGRGGLTHDPARGWLPSLLEALDVPVSSQTLVFSRTSFQGSRIGPDRPRALYFGDDVYVGWVPGAPLLEIASIDPRLGPVFYVLDQAASPDPRPQRAIGECLQCHGSPMTGDWPGLLLRSVHPDANGFPSYAAGTVLVDDRTPFEQRWGGWYVTGRAEELLHLGNAVLGPDQRALEPRALSESSALSELADASLYPASHSDLVALLVLEHQAAMHNVLARASYEVRCALERERLYDEALGGDRAARHASTRRIVERQARLVVDHLLFRDEAPLPGPVRGSSTFAQEFVARGVRDSAGRTLRELDLERRLLVRPCSWVIDSPAFDALPQVLLDALAARLDQVLDGAPAYDEYPRLSLPKRGELREILRETKPALAARWGD